MLQDKGIRIGIDFDNTIACYDNLFSRVAKSLGLLDENFEGDKRLVRDALHALPEGDFKWQRLQGKIYGDFILEATSFPGFTDFLNTCKRYPSIEIVVISHKTQFGHFDEKKIDLRDAARNWLFQQGLVDGEGALIKASNVYFESTQEEKLARIKNLECTHFIDDLFEILESPLFPRSTERILFQPRYITDLPMLVDDEPKTIVRAGYKIEHHSNWNTIKNAFFTR